MTIPATAQTDAERIAVLEAKLAAVFDYFEALSERTGIPAPSDFAIPPPRPSRPNPHALKALAGGAR